MSVEQNKIGQMKTTSSAESADKQMRFSTPGDIDRSDTESPNPQISSPRSLIPHRLKILFVSQQKPIWVGLALKLDEMGCSEPRFDWASSSEEALELLRSDSYDCLLIAVDNESMMSQLELLNAIRISGCEDPVILVLSEPDDRAVLTAYENDAEVLVSAAIWESQALLSSIQKTLKMHQLIEENHRLQVENHRRLIRERDEAERLLIQQRSMVKEMQTLAYPEDAENSLSLEGIQDGEESVQPFQVPSEVKDYYHELLRTYVIMGSGSLKDEIHQIAELLAGAKLTPRQVLEFHIECVESIVKGLGNRSSRHVLARADLLALEMMIHLGECYQKKVN